MLNEESNPEVAPPADSGRPDKPRGAEPGALPASRVNLPNAAALILAACLLLAAISLHLPRRSGRAPVTPDGLASPGGTAEPAAPGFAGGTREKSLTPPGAGREESLVPPVPGLLMSQRTFETLSYTGNPSQSPAALDKETAEDRAGCEARDMFKCLRLGGRYLAGHGVEKDAGRAFSLVNKACAGGVAEACTMQGIMQMSGYGTARDVPAAAALYDKTCGAGDMTGCTMLGSMYLEGQYVPADAERGLGLLRKACDAKVAASCMALGVLYLEGKAVPPDAAAAEQLLGRACELKDKSSCQLLQQLAQKRAAAENGL